jgi:hypothetical protein
VQYISSLSTLTKQPGTLEHLFHRLLYICERRTDDVTPRNHYEIMARRNLRPERANCLAQAAFCAVPRHCISQLFAGYKRRARMIQSIRAHSN